MSRTCYRGQVTRFAPQGLPCEPSEGECFYLFCRYTQGIGERDRNRMPGTSMSQRIH